MTDRTIARAIAVCALLLAVGACYRARPVTSPPAHAPGVAARASDTTRAVREYSVEEFLNTVAMRGASFARDGRTILVSTNATGVFNAYAIPADGGAPVQLTRSTTDNVYAQSYFPSDDRVLYASDQGGNELTHLFVRERDGGVRDLTPGAKVKARFIGWSRDDRAMFVGTTERDPRVFDVYEIAADGYARALLYTNTSGYEVADVSPDRRYVALNRRITLSNSDVYLYDRRTSALTNLTPHTGEVASWARTFAPDGKSLYFTTDSGTEFKYLVRQELAGGRREVVDRPAWDVEGAEFSRDGRYLIVSVDNDARTELHLYDAATMRRVALPDLPNADIGGVAFSADGRRMAYYVNGSRSPSDLWVRDIATGGDRQLTHNLSPRVNAADLVEARVVRFRSYDGAEIPGLLYQPHQAGAAAKVPALVWVHGGPGDQSRYGYNAFIQYLANHGYAVYAINNRGSSGYGKTFYTMDDRKHGEADLDDCVASKRMLTATGWVDSTRVGIIGGSYGGYMVLAALTFRPAAFAVGVDMYGVSNWLRTLASVPPWWGALRTALVAEMGDPMADRAYLARISPLFHAGEIRRPLMVLQGANDPRVLKAESDEIVAAVRANHVPVQYVVFPDEGHGFAKRVNQITAYKATLDFLARYLKTDPAARSAAP